MATTGKIAEVLFESTKETYEHQMQMLPLMKEKLLHTVLLTPWMA